VDDVKKDAQTHNYKWTMQLAADIVIESSADKGNGMYDVILKESAGNRRLLVRMLFQKDYQNGTPPAGIDTTWYSTGDGKSYKGYRLVCESNAVSPDFKVMLFPFTDGEQLPATTWNTDKSKLTVSWNDEQTNLGFAQSSGLTKVSLLSTGLRSATKITGLSISPNPAKNAVLVKDVENSTVSVYDISGKEVLKKKCSDNEEIMNVSQLANACYVVRAVDGESVKQARMLVNK